MPLSLYGEAVPVIITNGVDLTTPVSAGGGGGGTQYAEDAAHVSGDTGTMALGVRRDADTSPVSTDGDYHAPIFDAAGNLKVNVKIGGSSSGTIVDGVDAALKATVTAAHELLVSTPHLTAANDEVTVHGKTDQITPSITVSTSPAYTAGDCIGGKLTLTSAVLSSGGTGRANGGGT